MAYVRVDVELDVFSDSEIIHELGYRLNNQLGMTKAKKLELRERIIKEVLHGVNDDSKPFKIGTMVNQQKLDFLMENIENISLEQLENLIKKVARPSSTP